MTDNLQTQASSDKNRHIRDYLSFYLSLPHPPHYAVMITGPWGIGKTFLIDKLLHDVYPANQLNDQSGRWPYIYVSLYGLASRDEIDAALYEAIYPFLGSTLAKAGGSIGIGLLKKFGVDLSELKIGEPDADLYVFDDLERCEMPINKVLGYINDFVEHKERKVIIVANEPKIQDEKYRNQREKLIGKTLEVQSTFDEALDYFIAQNESPSIKLMFQERRTDVAIVYQQSNLNNLRILQQTMWDFERFFATLSDTHRTNKEAVTHLLRLFFALSFELKGSRFEQEDLVNRRIRAFAAYTTSQQNKDAEKSNFEKAQDRYPDISLEDNILSDALLIDILVKGIVDEQAIRAELDRSHYFLPRDAEPAWRTVWNYRERTDEEFTTAFSKMERQFSAREFLDPGVILHVFGLRLFLSSEVKMLKKSLDDIVSEGKKYVDDLYTSRRLVPISREYGELFADSYDGLGLVERESNEFRTLYGYLQDKRQKAAEDKYPDDAAALLKEMQTDPHLYYRRLCLTNSDDNWYYRSPILAAIDPETFVSSLLQQSPENQGLIWRTFKARYEHGDLNGDLAAEKPWLEKVREKLQQQAEGLSAMGQYLMRQRVASCITHFLEG